MPPGPVALAVDEQSDLARAKVLNEQVVRLYGEGRYGDAIPKAEEMLAILERDLGPETS